MDKYFNGFFILLFSFVDCSILKKLFRTTQAFVVSKTVSGQPIMRRLNIRYFDAKIPKVFSNVRLAQDKLNRYTFVTSPSTCPFNSLMDSTSFIFAWS